MKSIIAFLNPDYKSTKNDELVVAELLNKNYQYKVDLAEKTGVPYDELHEIPGVIRSNGMQLVLCYGDSLVKKITFFKNFKNAKAIKVTKSIYSVDYGLDCNVSLSFFNNGQLLGWTNMCSTYIGADKDQTARLKEFNDEVAELLEKTLEEMPFVMSIIE